MTDPTDAPFAQLAGRIIDFQPRTPTGPCRRFIRMLNGGNSGKQLVRVA